MNIPTDAFPYVHAIQGAESKKLVKYFVNKMQVHNMPEHSSRPGVRESRIVLAFPFNDTNGPIIDNQHIFAFMPLRKTSLSVNQLALSINLIVSF